MGFHIVKRGECLSSLAARYSFPDYRTIYDHPENADLRKRRPNPNLLLPGDRVYVPNWQLKQYSLPTDATHKFKMRGGKVWLRLRICNDQHEPVDAADYVLDVEGVRTSGRTDADGLLAVVIPAKADRARLELSYRDSTGCAVTRCWSLQLGDMDPVSELTGIQARLNNLGFWCGEVDGIMGPRTKAAVRRFQEWAGLTVDGIPGPKTQGSLEQKHGC